MIAPPLQQWLIGAAILFCSVSAAQADVAVIVNLDNPIDAMTSTQVADFFLGRTRMFKSGIDAMILEHPRDSQLREEFFRRINGMSIKQLNAYWARLQFSGEIQPPPTLKDSRAVLESVRKNRNAIGYIDAGLVDNSIRVVLRLKD